MGCMDRMRNSTVWLPPQFTPNCHSRHLVALVIIGVGTLLILNQFARRTTNTLPLSPTPQGGQVVAIHNPQQVPSALLQFKFATNQLVLHLALLTYNLLRVIGQARLGGRPIICAVCRGLA